MHKCSVTDFHRRLILFWSICSGSRRQLDLQRDNQSRRPMTHAVHHCCDGIFTKELQHVPFNLDVSVLLRLSASCHHWLETWWRQCLPKCIRWRKNDRPPNFSRSPSFPIDQLRIGRRTNNRVNCTWADWSTSANSKSTHSLKSCERFPPAETNFGSRSCCVLASNLQLSGQSCPSAPESTESSTVALSANVVKCARIEVSLFDLDMMKSSCAICVVRRGVRLHDCEDPAVGPRALDFGLRIVSNLRHTCVARMGMDTITKPCTGFALFLSWTKFEFPFPCAFSFDLCSWIREEQHQLPSGSMPNLPAVASSWPRCWHKMHELHHTVLAYACPLTDETFPTIKSFFESAREAGGSMIYRKGRRRMFCIANFLPTRPSALSRGTVWSSL